MKPIRKEKRAINEMAQRADRRIFARLDKYRKYVYLMGRFAELNPERRGVYSPEAEKLKKYATANGVDWEDFFDTFHINKNATSIERSFLNKFSEDGQYAKLYKRIKRTIEVNKDEIDKNYIDKFYDFYNGMRRGEDWDELYEKYDMGEFIEWLKANEDEAKERLGPHYSIALRYLARWMDPSYPGSDIEAMDNWQKWYKDNEGHTDDAEMPDELKYRMAIVYQQPNIATLCSARTKQAIEKTLKARFPGERIPSIAACRAKLGQEVDFDELSSTEKLQVMINKIPENLDERIAPNIRNVINEFIDATGFDTAINEEAINKADATIVRAVYSYVKNTVNRECHVGMEVPFNQTSLQNFYDTYKPVFLLGLNEEPAKALFKQFGERIKEALVHEVEARLADGDSDTDSDLELESAMLVARKHGYIVT